MRVKFASLWTLAGLLLSQPLFAIGSVQIINYYEIILQQFGLDEHAIHEWMQVLGAISTLLLTTFLGLKYSKAIRPAGENLVPESRFGVRSFFWWIQWSPVTWHLGDGGDMTASSLTKAVIVYAMTSLLR